jgi:hypothetical protein
MSKPQQTIFVAGHEYQVRENSEGLLRADMDGYFDWTNVWADTYPNLVQRIKKVRSGGQ